MPMPGMKGLFNHTLSKWHTLSIIHDSLICSTSNCFQIFPYFSCHACIFIFSVVYFGAIDYQRHANFYWFIIAKAEIKSPSLIFLFCIISLKNSTFHLLWTTLPGSVGVSIGFFCCFNASVFINILEMENSVDTGICHKVLVSMSLIPLDFL